MPKPSNKYEITDRIVEKLGFRNHQGASTYLTRLNLKTLKWLEEGIDLLKPKPLTNITEDDIKRKAIKLVEANPLQKIKAVKELREYSGLGLKESLTYINLYWN